MAKEPWQMTRAEYLKEAPGDLAVRVGGSNRLLDRQWKAFAHAGIPIRDCGQAAHGHWSNRHACMPDTPAARELLKKVGGRIAREQPYYYKAEEHHRMAVMGALARGEPVPDEVQAEYQEKPKQMKLLEA